LLYYQYFILKSSVQEKMRFVSLPWSLLLTLDSTLKLDIKIVENSLLEWSMFSDFCHQDFGHHSQSRGTDILDGWVSTVVIPKHQSSHSEVQSESRPKSDSHTRQRSEKEILVMSKVSIKKCGPNCRVQLENHVALSFFEGRGAGTGSGPVQCTVLTVIQLQNAFQRLFREEHGLRRWNIHHFLGSWLSIRRVCTRSDSTALWRWNPPSSYHKVVFL
jgi:hypothetical protein